MLVKRIIMTKISLFGFLCCIILAPVKFVIRLLLIVALLMQTMHQSIVYFGYTINQEIITKKFCENKSKPQLNCHGKCHLKKELQKEEERNKSLPSVKQLSDVMIFSELSTSALRLYALKEAALIIPFDQNEVSFFSSGIFQPPKG